MNNVIELQILLNHDGGIENDINTFQQAINNIKHSPENVFLGFAPINSYNIDPIIRLLCTSVDYYKLSPIQKRLLLVLWNFLRRRLSSEDANIIDREVYSDLLGLLGLEMLYSCVLPGSIISTRPRLGSKWLRLSLSAFEVQKLINTVDTLIEAVYDRSPMEVLASIFPSFHSIRLPQLEGRTILHIICSDRNLSTEKLIKDILRAGLDSSAQDNQGKTALHIAAQHFNWTAANALTVLVPTIRQIVDNRGDIALVTLLRAMSVSPWIKVISPERISSLINILTPSSFYREFWSMSLHDKSLNKFLVYGDETVVSQCLVALKRDISFPLFQSLLFHLITSISKRCSRALVLLHTANELLPLVTADLMRLHGDNVESIELCAFFLDLVLGISFKFRNIDLAVEGIAILNKLFDSQDSFCHQHSWVFPHYALLILDTELLRSVLDKFSVESFDFFFLQRWSLSSSELPAVSSFPILPLREIMQKWLLQEAAPSSYFLFEASNTVENQSAYRMSIVELACASHANIALHAICKSAQRVFRETDNNRWFSLQERCLSQALKHHNWKAIDLIKVLHDALFLHSKNKAVSMTLTQTTVEEVCSFLSNCFSSAISHDANDDIVMKLDEDMAQTLGRLIACFPAMFTAKKENNIHEKSMELGKQIKERMEDITNNIDHLLLSIRGLGPGGALTTPIIWKNHLKEGSYQEYHAICLAHEKELTDIGTLLYSSFHGATLRRISRNFVPDLKWQKLAYSLLMFLDCIEKPDKLLSSSAEYDNIYDKQWSRVESMFAVAARSTVELQKWSERVLSGLNALVSWSENNFISTVQKEALEFFISKYQNLGNLRYANNRPSNKNIAGMTNPSEDSMFPTMEKLQAYKRESATFSDMYTLYDRIITYFATIVAPKLLQISREGPTTRQNHSQHLTFKEYLFLNSLDQQYQRLSDVCSQLKNDQDDIAVKVVEGDFLQCIFANDVPRYGLTERNNSSFELLFIHDLQFFAGQRSAWSKINQTLAQHRMHQRNSSLIYSHNTLLDETMKMLIERCDCSAERLLSYVQILTQNQCFQSATIILQRYHQHRLQFSFEDWNVFHGCYFAQPRMSRNGKTSRLFHFLTLNAALKCSECQDNLMENIIQQLQNVSFQPCLYDRKDQLRIYSPLHFALLHNQTDFIRMFLSIFPRYPVNLHSLAILIEMKSLHLQWQRFLPLLSHITKFIVIDSDVHEWQSLLIAKKQLSLHSRMGGSNGCDLRFGQTDRSYFLSTWNLIQELILSIHHQQRIEKAVDWVPSHWFVTNSPLSSTSLSPSVYALSQTRQECDYVTKTAKLFSPLVQPPSSPTKPSSLSTSTITTSTTTSNTIRLMAMMDGTWMSFEDVTSQYHNYQRALPAPLILEGHGSLAHVLCAFLTNYIEDNDQGQEFLSFLLSKLPELTKLFFLRLGKSKPSPFYLILRDGKYSLALMIMKRLASNSQNETTRNRNNDVDGILKFEQSLNDGLLREHVLSTLKKNLQILRGMFPVPSIQENKKIPHELLSNEDNQLFLEKYLVAHDKHTELTFCASCLEYSQDLWRKLIQSPSTAQQLSATSSRSTANFTKVLVFSQHASRADLLKHDSVVRARQVLSILQIAYSQLIPTVDANRVQNKDRSIVIHNNDSIISNPDLLYLSPSYLCRRVTASMFHQLKLLLTGWLHPKLISTGENTNVKKVFASLQVMDDNLLFHHPSFSCLQFLSDELRQYQSATILDKENVISSYLSHLPTYEQVPSSKNNAFGNGNSTGGISLSSPASNNIMLQLVRPEDWAALDTISCALLILEYARSLCIARISCVISYPEDMNTWIPSSYAKHPLTVVKRQIATLAEDIIALEREIKNDNLSINDVNEVLSIPRMYLASQQISNLNRGLRSRIGLLDRLTPDDMITFLQCSAVYSPRLKRLRDVLVSSISSMLTDLGKLYAGKMISRLEKKIHIPNYHNKDTSKLPVFGTTAGIPVVFSSAFEADLRVLSEDIIPLLRSLRLMDFWQTGKFPLFRHTFENVVIENDQDFLIDMVHSLKQGIALTVTEEEESTIYFAFQRQAPIDTSSVTAAFGTSITTGSLQQKSPKTTSPRQPYGHSIPYEITQSQRLYSKSAMDTVHRLRQALHTASVLYWFVGSCYGLIAESRTSTLFDDDLALVLDVFHTSPISPPSEIVKDGIILTKMEPSLQLNTLFHPLLPLITQNPSTDVKYEKSSFINQSLIPTAMRPEKTTGGAARKPHHLVYRSQQRLELIRFMIDSSYNKSLNPSRVEYDAIDLNQAQHSIHIPPRHKSTSSLVFLSKNSLLPMGAFIGTAGGRKQNTKDNFSLLEIAAFHGDVETVFYLLPHLSRYLGQNEQQKTEIDYIQLNYYWSNLLWYTLACAKINAAKRYEECFRLLWDFHCEHIFAISGHSLSFLPPSALKFILEKENEPENKNNMDIQSLTTIDLAAVKSMPSLVIDLFDHLIAQAANAAVTEKASSSAASTSQIFTPMQEVKHSASIISLAALSLHSLKCTTNDADNSVVSYQKAFQSLLSALYAQSKQGRFNLYELFHLEHSLQGNTDILREKLGAIFVQECISFGQALTSWTQIQQSSVSTSNDSSSINWVQVLQDRFTFAFQNNESKSIINSFRNPLFQDISRLSKLCFVRDNMSEYVEDSSQENSQENTRWTLLNLAIIMNDTALFMKQLEIDFPSLSMTAKPQNAAHIGRKVVSPVKSSSDKETKQQQMLLWQRFQDVILSLIELERVFLLNSFVVFFESTFKNDDNNTNKDHFCWWVEKLLPHLEDEQRSKLSIAIYEIKTLFFQKWFPLLCKKNCPSVCDTLKVLVDAFFVPMVRFAGNIPSISDEYAMMEEEERKQRQRLWVIRLVEDDILPLLVQKSSFRDSYLVLLLEGLWNGCTVDVTVGNKMMKVDKNKINKENILLEEIRNLFVDYRQPLNASCDAFSPLLHMWIRRRQFHLVQFWIQHVSPNIILIQDHAGYTALDTAIGTGDGRITKLMKPLLPFYVRKTLQRMIRALHGLRLKRVIARSEAFLAQFEPVQQAFFSPISKESVGHENHDLNSSNLSSLSSR